MRIKSRAYSSENQQKSFKRLLLRNAKERFAYLKVKKNHEHSETKPSQNQDRKPRSNDRKHKAEEKYLLFSACVSMLLGLYELALYNAIVKPKREKT